MPVPIAALFAAAIYQQRSALSGAEEVDHTVDLLSRATSGSGVTFEVRGDDLLINGLPLSLEAPGVAIIRHALVDHQTARLTLPRAMKASQWRAVVELFASAPGLYPTVDELRDALRFTVPDSTVSSSSGAAAEGDLRQSLFELPGLRATGSPNDHSRSVDSRDAVLAKLATALDPLLGAAARDRDNRDYNALAEVLLQIQELAADKDAEQKAIISRERRRVVPSHILEAMARQIPKSGTSSPVARVLGMLGQDGAAAILDALSGAPGPHERRAYIDTLVASRDCDVTIVEALGSTRTEIVRDAAEVVGRKRMEHAVPLLAHLLKHTKVDVRTTAWHALELIGTRDALNALRS